MQEAMKRLNPVAIKCIRNAFQEDPKKDEMENLQEFQSFRSGYLTWSLSTYSV